MMFEMIGYLVEAIEARARAPRRPHQHARHRRRAARRAGAPHVHRAPPDRGERDDHQPRRQRDARALGESRAAATARRCVRRSCRACVEEALRYDTPVQALSRQTTTAVDVGGVTIPEGQRVYVLYASANRDAEHFDDPERFRRSTASRAITSRSAAASTSASALRWHGSKARSRPRRCSLASARSSRGRDRAQADSPARRAPRCSAASLAFRCVVEAREHRGTMTARGVR